MKIAYIISAYKNPLQLVRLVYKLNQPSATFWIHIDKKAGSNIFNQVKQSLTQLDNIYLLDRHTCYWGNFGHVEATLKAINAIRKKDVDYDYAVLLTGQCYPIKSNQAIRQFLEQNQPRSFIEHYPVPPHLMKRIERWHFRIFSRFYFPFPNKYLSISVRRSMINEFQPYFYGSSYWCLHKECIEYIHNFLNNDLKNDNGKFINFFRMVYIPDEFFFQTILVNSPLRKTLVNNGPLYVKWPSLKYAPSPLILSQSNFSEISTSPKLFARKFDITRDSKILDMIDAMT